ncbi:hypothetical protein BU25DRAFT_416096 [Macroventuria anomochaeta]|uniref:Uncharacterized protein n=1 Tax=Macroventuria anomochaeta TaxID=301207 RepID=A0ACB6RK01_9PLEO|nr:uncharacterized protein BU25DRAFT_416096 [Macroventuria anomochaeta]KAF2621428.1 hypothetical protein BU25DRAFT_416096 [Macroventuria anomochaeta]
MKGCVPNDCVAECAPWYAISLVLFKRPFCPCKVVTCKPDDDEDDDCNLFGCGCGWMGLPFGPGCDITSELPNIFPLGLFGPNPCLFFGGCPPGVGPPNPDPCGPFGCNGYCNLPQGCDPCPPEICGGPLKCPKPEGCGPTPGPNPTPNPTRPTKCEKEQETTVTEKLVYCKENIKLEPTTIASLNFTLTSTLTSMCLTPILYTRTGCGVLDTTATTTISSFTTTSSNSAPMCSRVPLDLNNDEGDNEQPTSSEGPSCTRAPLSLDDDEGDNEQPTSYEAPACIRAPLSLDDDEGNNEMPADTSSSLSLSFSHTASTTSSAFSSTPTPSSNSSSIVSSTSMVMTSSSSLVSRVPPPSILSMSTTPPWGTDIPSGTPAPANCPTCNEYFDKCVKGRCNSDGSNAEKCAKECLAALCYSGDSINYCKKGPCRPAACPKENPMTFENAQPGAPFTTVLFLSGTKITVSPTPSYSTVSLPHSPTPTCKPGHTISPTGNWTVLVEHEIKEKPDNATLTWRLWDEHGCEAGSGSGWNNILGANLTQEIGAWDRAPGWNMGYALHTHVTESTSASQSEIEFEISRFPAGCMEICWTKWKINTRDESKSWQITDDCARQCGMRKLGPTDVGCDDGINKWHDNGDSSIQKRGGYCWFHMSFEPGDDRASPPPKPWTRDSRWTLELVQQMEYEDASIEWWLKDPNGNHAGHFWFGLNAEDVDVVGSTLIETQDRDAHPELKMRYKMLLTVAYPRNKDNTTITLTYQNGKIDGCKYSSDTPSKVLGLLPLCQPSYQTESNDRTKQSHLNDCSSDPDRKIEICPTSMLAAKLEFSCDKIPDAFYPKGAGFERKFKCWWPHDFVAPYGNMDDVGTMDFGGMNGTFSALRIDSEVSVS